MGFIKAFTGAFNATLADQWKDFYGPKQGVSATAAIFQAVPQSTNAGVGENTKGSNNIISNGSKIIVPEGTALVTMQDGQITGFIAEAGGFIYQSDDPNSQSLFAGDGILSSTIKQTWERVKFGGQPGSQQLAFYVNMKEIPNNKFGTQSPIVFYDNFLQTQATVSARGTYTLQIVDPLLFIKNFVPMQYLQPEAQDFDFSDMDNAAGQQLFTEVVSGLGQTLSVYSNSDPQGGTLMKIQSDPIGLAKSMQQVVEENYQWTSSRGLKIVRVAMVPPEYDEETTKLYREIQEDDREVRKSARMGAAYANNMAGMMAYDSGQALKNAASNENGAMMGFMGMNIASMQANNIMGAANAAVQQPTTPTEPVATPQSVAEDPYAKLTEMKKLLDAGVITQEDFDAAKAKLLGI
ncbi:MAG: SPFH domain-containing protein [bacterium]|nr:SPFH domain-containing protein [bacterium]